MFGRYTEPARRVIFFARYEARQPGSPYMETEHRYLKPGQYSAYISKFVIAAIRRDDGERIARTG